MSARLSSLHIVFSTRLLYILGFTSILWVSFAFQLHLLDRFPLREDEAIYSFWALHFWPNDPWFLTVWPDKPPLFVWLLAVIFQLWGASQASGRLLNVMLTLLTALVVGATARRLWGQRSAFGATLLYLLNPFVLSSAPTVYTDPLLVLAGQLALFCAVTGRSLGAGFWLAVAMMTKQQGVLYVPLILVLLAVDPVNRRATAWLRFVLGALVVLGPLVYWDSLRWAVAPSPWDLSLRNYGALQWISPGTWLTRSTGWAAWIWYFTASWPVWLCVSALIVAALWQQGVGCYRWSVSGPQTWRGLGIACWSFGFLALHIMTTVQLWDRYLLPLAPMFCLGVAWATTQMDMTVSPAWFRRGLLLVALLGVLCLVPPALTAATGGLPIGGDHGAYQGLTEAIAWLATQAPANGVLYHQQLGWHYQFYLYGQIASGAYELRWFPNTTYLAANAARIPNRPRFLVVPDWAPQPALALQLAVQRIRLIPAARFGQMTVYALQNEVQARCDWCLCKLPMPQLSWPMRDLSKEQVQP